MKMIKYRKARLGFSIMIIGTVLSFSFMAWAQTPIGCGETLEGSISEAGERDSYTFTASANDRVTLRAQKRSGTFTPYLELYSPSGTRIGSAANQMDRTLTQAGTYRVDLRDQTSTNTGDYLLFWQKINSPSNMISIGCGEVLSGSIGTSVEVPPWKVYTFLASAGDVVSIRSLKTSATSFVSYVELYDPNGSYLGGSYNAPLRKALSTPGIHTILLRDYYKTYAGEFLLIWERMNNPCGRILGCGETASGAIGRTVNEPFWGFYRISASANDVVKIRVLRTSGDLAPYLELYNKNGTSLASCAGEINTTLALTGPYTIVVRDQDNSRSGGYALTWQRWNDPGAQAMDCGQVVFGSVGLGADPPPWRYYSFSASPNDIVTIRVTKTSGSFTPYFELYGPTGTKVGSSTGQLDKVLAAAGSHTVLVRDQKSVSSGEFLLTWQRVNSPCGAVIGCGQELVGSVGRRGEIGAYAFTASEGDTVVLTLRRTEGGLDPSLELYDGNGTRLSYGYTVSGEEATISQVLSSGGTYTVFVSDYGNEDIGGYRLKFQKNNNICPEVRVRSPNGGERLVIGSSFTIRWACTSSVGIDSQEIRLSTDGGRSFPNVIARGLRGGVQSYSWVVPEEMVGLQGRIRLVVTDTWGRETLDDSDRDFEFYHRVGRMYVYDELNRLSQIIYEDGRKVTYTYDASGNRLTLMNE